MKTFEEIFVDFLNDDGNGATLIKYNGIFDLEENIYINEYFLINFNPLDEVFKGKSPVKIFLENMHEDLISELLYPEDKYENLTEEHLYTKILKRVIKKTKLKDDIKAVNLAFIAAAEELAVDEIQKIRDMGFDERFEKMMEMMIKLTLDPCDSKVKGS